jgi:DNA-binding response OmpR family regulator
MNATAGARILLIDDDRHMHEAVRLILEPLGYEVHCFTTVPDGQAHLEQSGADLLLLDIMLSTPTEGLEFRQQLRQNQHYDNLRIIMFSSVAAPSGQIYAQELGDDRIDSDMFLEKPLDARTLREAVAHQLAPPA